MIEGLPSNEIQQAINGVIFRPDFDLVAIKKR